MKRVLLLATTTGYQIRSFSEAAERLEIRLVFASDRCDQLDDPWYDRAIPVRFHEPERSLDAILDGLGGAPLHGVLAVGDRPTMLAARVAARFELPGNPPSAALASANKLLTRQALAHAGLPAPSFRTAPLTADVAALARDSIFPAVLKPLALSGSRGVIRANNPTEFVTAFERLRSLLTAVDVRAERDAALDHVMIESFIPGREYAVEALVTCGVFRPLAILDKPDPLDGPFFEETIYVTPSRHSPAEQERLVNAVADAVSSLGLWHGPIHAECRVNEAGVHVLEVAARPIGGLCSRALRFTTDSGSQASLEEVLLRHATQQDVSAWTRESHASGVMMIPIPRRGIYKAVEGVADAAAVPDVTDVRITAKPDVLLVPLPEGKSYLGFIFARGDSPEAVEHALRTAHGQLRFVIEKEIAVVG